MHRSRSYVGAALFLLLFGISVRLLAQDQKSPSPEERAKAVESCPVMVNQPVGQTSVCLFQLPHLGKKGIATSR